jgi:formate hydrogenlyase subunit 3/multisubunit Na+/H+ antiporter MnhD subunit
MSLAVYLAVTFGFAAGGWLTRGRGAFGTAIGIGGLFAAFVAATAINPDEILRIGEGGLASTAYVRLFLIIGSLVGLGLAIADQAAGARRDLATVTLATLGMATLTLSLTDPRAAVIAGTAGGLCGALLTIAPGGDRAGAAIGIRDLRAVVIAGTMAVAATAWLGRDLGQLDAPPVVFGLAYLAVALAVAIRFGAIPFHLWVSRLTDAVPDAGLPIVTVLAAAPFAVVGLAWVDASVAPLLVDLGTERGIVLAIAVASIVLAAIAALVQDELEHVVGYSIVGDAGVALLAFVALDPTAWGAARTWILTLVVTRSAFAAWAAAVRIGFGTGRIAGLRGWLAGSPVLGVAFGLIVIASLGFPGLAAFEARSTLVNAAVDGPFAMALLIGTLAPIAYYGRLLSVGLARPDGAMDRTAWRPRWTPVNLNAPVEWWRTTRDSNRIFSGSLVAAVLGLLALSTAAGAFGASNAAAGPAAGGSVPITTAQPSASVELVPLPIE